MLLNILLFLMFLIALGNYLSAQTPIVAAYYENSSQYRPPSGNRKVFSPSMIDPELLTDLYFAFAYFGFINKSVDPSNPRLTGDFLIHPTNSNDQTVLYPQIMALKQRNKALRVFLSIGGWNFNNPNDSQDAGKYTLGLFSRMISTTANRKQFIDSSIEYAHKYGFDGIDIDWEYPGDVRRGGTEDDFSNFITFLKECAEAFHTTTPPLLLSYAAPAFVPAGLPKTYVDNPSSYFKWLAECARYLDRINLMAYDYHGPFDDPKITGANAPLDRDTNPMSIYFIAKSIEYYLDNGVPPNKIVLGIPTFGHSFEGVQGLENNKGPGNSFTSAGMSGPSTKMPGFLAYYEVADLIAGKQLEFGTDSLTSTAYGYQIMNQKWVSFDTPETTALKVKLALNKRLGGVIFWSIDMDEYQWPPTFPNIRSIRQ